MLLNENRTKSRFGFAQETVENKLSSSSVNQSENSAFSPFHPNNDQYLYNNNIPSIQSNLQQPLPQFEDWFRNILPDVNINFTSQSFSNTISSNVNNFYSNGQQQQQVFLKEYIY